MSWKQSMPNGRKPSRQEFGQAEAARYIRENFESADRLAVVLLNKRTEDVIQRIATADKIAADDFQAWLRAQNAHGYEIYLSMNALNKGARGRTKADVETIRHIYLDFDAQGTAAVEKLLAREDLPAPNYLINTSPGKWQVVWKVEGFRKDQAEQLQQALAREMGADPAATDCSRVLRLPGFYSRKYTEPFRIASQKHATAIYGPDQFPQIPAEARGSWSRADGGIRRAPARPSQGGVSQSERDWAYAKRALARGEREEVVIAAVASHRRYDKHNPQYYAEHPVRKAAQSLRLDGARRGAGSDGPER